jgi:type VI protein secretion system component VasF
MDWLDDELKRAFARQEPPPDFAARAIARAHRGRRLAVPRWAVAAALALAIAGAGYGYRWRQGEAAKQQVLLAFRIASTKVNHIQMQVLR